MYSEHDAVNPVGYKPAVLSWLENLISERIVDGVRCEVVTDGRVSLTLTGSDKSINIAANLGIFRQFGVSDLPCGWWDLDGNVWGNANWAALPVPGYAIVPQPLIVECDSGFDINIDLLGIVYWMLNRIEEIGSDELDEHRRIPAASSHAYQNSYLERPIVDEWLYVLGQVIKRTWPSIEIKRHHFAMMVSHDVDVPSCYAFQNNIRRIIWHMGGDIYRRHNLVSGALGPWIRFRSSKRLHPLDSMNTFDWMMEQSEKHGLTSAFNFICGRTNARFDADYDVDAAAIRQLLRDIHRRGHEIGLHPSYETYLDPQELVSEADTLKRVCSEEGIHQDEWGGRMHVLRWQHPETLYGWEQAGMSYDNTLSYADHAGFRCGTCFDYQAFDPVAEKALNLKIRPLIAMEVTVIADRYMALGTGELAYEKFDQLKSSCKAVGGTFTLLWHNHMLTTHSERRLYSSILE